MKLFYIFLLLSITSCATNNKIAEEEYRISKKELCEDKKDCKLTLPHKNHSDYVEYHSSNGINSTELPSKKLDK